MWVSTAWAGWCHHMFRTTLAVLRPTPGRDSRAARELGTTRGIHTSTSEVYGDPEIHPQPEIYNGNVKFTTSAGTDYDAEGVVDRDCYGTLMTTLQAANTAGVEVRYETLGIETVGNFMWEDAGLPEDPGRNLRIALTIETVAATAAAGDITMVVEYIVN